MEGQRTFNLCSIIHRLKSNVHPHLHTQPHGHMHVRPRERVRAEPVDTDGRTRKHQGYQSSYTEEALHSRYNPVLRITPECCIDRLLLKE